MSQEKLISINIPCYNRSEMLRECIMSFVNQTYTDWEMIVLDDGSEEDLTFVTDIDPRIKYFRQDPRCYAKVWNVMMDLSSGKYIMPFGSDDIASSEDFLKNCIEFLKQDLECDIVYTDHWLRGINGSEIRQKIGVDKTSLTGNDAYEEMLNRQYIPHPGTLWKKEKVPRYDESLESAQDWELFLTAIENGIKFGHISKRLWTYRVGHPREANTQRQVDCCDRLLKKRGYYFNKETRSGVKICN